MLCTISFTSINFSQTITYTLLAPSSYRLLPALQGIYVLPRRFNPCKLVCLQILARAQDGPHALRDQSLHEPEHFFIQVAVLHVAVLLLLFHLTLVPERPLRAFDLHHEALERALQAHVGQSHREVAACACCAGDLGARRGRDQLVRAAVALDGLPLLPQALQARLQDGLELAVHDRARAVDEHRDLGRRVVRERQRVQEVELPSAAATAATWNRAAAAAAA